MIINLRSDWTFKLKTNRVYSLEYENQMFVDTIFDKLHQNDKMKWFKNSTSFEYSIFVIWKTSYKNDKPIKKNKIVIDIRELNDITISDAYSMSFQTNIIVAVIECRFISIIDAANYFHQWTVKYENRYKQIVISHRDQKQFNVVVMKFKNSSAYVQRQTNFMLKNFRVFVKIFINDIIRFSRIRKNHLVHLKIVFERLLNYEIIFSRKKTFLIFPSLMLLKQTVDFLNMFTSKKKLTIIAKFDFSKTLKNLKTYLKFIEWLRNYVPYYAQVAKSFQQKKTILFKKNSTKKNSRKSFSKRTLIIVFTNFEYITYEHLQHVFSQSKFLIHFVIYKSLFIDVNASKQRKFDAMIFHVKSDSKKTNMIERKKIQFIMFLNKQLSEIENRYWFTKFEIAEMIWMIKKIRHMIEFCRKSPIIIFIDHSVTAGIIKQTSLIIENTEKLNFRLIKISQYFSTLSIKIKIKSKKFHLISDVLSRLKTKIDAIKKKTTISAILKNLNVKRMFAEKLRMKKHSLKNVISYRTNDELDFYLSESIYLLKMFDELKKRFKSTYDNDSQWKKIQNKIKKRQNQNDTFDEMNFISKRFRIFYASSGKTSRLCISWKLKKKFINSYTMRIIIAVSTEHTLKRRGRYIFDIWLNDYDGIFVIINSV